MSRRRVLLVRQSFPDPPALDTAVSRALMEAAADGSWPETFRIHRPAAVVAFGSQDVVSPGYPEAVRAARAEGFEGIERLAGGRAAVFHAGTIAFAWAIPEDDARVGITPRFEALAEVMVAAFQALGVDARVGEVPGEYCPGAYSVNAGGRTKLMGVGQRLVRRAAHVGGVVVVSGGDDVNRVLVPVYRALGLTWDPAVTGSLEDASGPVAWDAAASAIAAALADRYDVEEAEFDSALMARAHELEPLHRSPP